MHADIPLVHKTNIEAQASHRAKKVKMNLKRETEPKDHVGEDHERSKKRLGCLNVPEPTVWTRCIRGDIEVQL